MPGPMLTVTINQSYKKGFKAGPLIVLGHSILELILVTLLVYGLSHVLKNYLLIGLIALLGCLVLIWLSWGIFKEAKSSELEIPSSQQVEKDYGTGPAGVVFSGILVSLSNPYWFIWWATVGASMVIMGMKLGFLGISSFYIGHILSDLFWFSLVAGIIVSGKKVFNIKVYRIILYLCSIFLLGIGLYFAYFGIIKLYYY